MVENKYKQIDYQDSKAMWEFQMETLKVADDYAEARKGYAKNLKVQKLKLAESYKRNTIERKI